MGVRLDRQSSSPDERIRIFLDLAEYYFELTEAFPVTSSIVLGTEKTSEQTKDHWHRIVRLTAIRKFFLNTKDNVFIPKVLRSCKQLLPDTDSNIIDRAEASFQSVITSSIFRVKFSENGEDRRIPDLAEDFLNGMLLHGDAGKWKRHQQEKSAIEPVLNVKLVEFEAFLLVTKDSIEEWAAEGKIKI